MQQVRTCEKGILVQRSSWGEKADILKKDNQSSMKINSLNDCLSITGCCYQVFMLLSYWLRVQGTKIKREMMMIQPKSGTLCSITKRGSWECKGPYRSFFFFFFFHKQQHPALHHSHSAERESGVHSLTAHTTNGCERRRGDADVLQTRSDSSSHSLNQKPSYLTCYWKDSASVAH